MAQHEFTVEVEPQYLPEESDPGKDVYTFAYTITVTNSGQVPAQLISRHWIITHGSGRVEEVKGLGVVGHQPLLKPGQAFQYTSGCRLSTPAGSMRGSFFCVGEDGERFEAAIAPFILDAGLARVLH